jgi:uncharacterized protein (TIGR00252 family)
MPLPAWLRGRAAEVRAARWLHRQGLRIVAVNLRAGGGEIDLLALEGGVLVVVEVRTRKSGILAADLSVHRPKMQRIRRCLQGLVARRPGLRSYPSRGDLLLFGPTGPPAHLRGHLDLLGPEAGPEREF